ncbi:MAG: MFS transporter [Gammaproteobacteria bacterium]|nr:MFS transporter [Gammaproteobacteria bacterium]
MQTHNERQLVLVLAAIQFTHIMDFMIMMPMGPMLTTLFDISTMQFGALVSAYTGSAAVSSLLAAVIIDRFDRRAFLLFSYIMFSLATLACALAGSFEALMIARIAAGLFGGVIGITVQTIVGDVVPFERRGSAMGTLMAAFSVATVIGVPTGLFLANHLEWHAPFYLLALMGGLLTAIAYRLLPSINAHVAAQRQSTWQSLKVILAEPRYWKIYLFTFTMTATGFVVIPYITIYLQQNLQMSPEQIPLVYLVGGAATLITSPLIGKLADKIGKQWTFILLAILCTVPLFGITHLHSNTLWLVLAVTTLFFVLVSGRMIPSMALITQAPSPSQRGSFMSLNNTVQSAAMALAAYVGGSLAGQSGEQLAHYEVNGYVAIALSLLSTILLVRIFGLPAAGSAQIKEVKP